MSGFQGGLGGAVAGAGYDPTREQQTTAAAFEFLPNWVLYGPLVLYWILLGLRHRDFTLPTLANPTITTGGLCGESKSAILDQVGGTARHWIAPYAVFQTGPAAETEAARAMARLGLTYPVVLKPDVGCKGAGVRLVEDARAMADVLRHYPAGIDVMVQRLIPYPNEAGLFYSRHPDAPGGRILSMTFKFFPSVTGDGRRTIQDLIRAHPRAGRIPDVFLPRFAGRLDEVLPVGETLPLVFTGNHAKGSVFRNATHLVTPALEAQIDHLLRALPEFHHGRLDVRFDTVAALRDGQGFQIIEINGIGAEPIHMWDPAARLGRLFREQALFYGRAFTIGAAMRRRGHRSKGVFDLLRAWRRQRQLIATYPQSS